MEEFVKLKDITKVYHMGEVEIRAADNINFSIKKGEFVVIVGPSGAGKTTVLNILGGMDTATGGTLTVDGKDITAYDSRQLTGYRRDDIGFVFQFYNLIPNLTALENVELALQICKDPLDAKKVLEDVGLGDRLDNFPAQLSGGEQQRVAVAMTLAFSPEVLLMDEPTSALDTVSVIAFLNRMKKLIDKGSSILFVTHNIRAAAYLSDQLLIMKHGEIIEAGRRERLMNMHGEPYTEELLRATVDLR